MKVVLEFIKNTGTNMLIVETDINQCEAENLKNPTKIDPFTKSWLCNQAPPPKNKVKNICHCIYGLYSYNRQEIQTLKK